MTASSWTWGKKQTALWCWLILDVNYLQDWTAFCLCSRTQKSPAAAQPERWGGGESPLLPSRDLGCPYLPSSRNSSSPLWDASPPYPAVNHSPRPGMMTGGPRTGCKEKADQEQALAWLRENSNSDARPGRKRYKKVLLKKGKRKRNPKPHCLKRQWGHSAKEEGSTSCINTGCLPQLWFWRTRTSKNKNGVLQHFYLRRL